MENDWAVENLQVIRTLMESSAIYRRALAPVMGVVGVTGIAAGVLGSLLNFQTSRAFVVYWMLVAWASLVEALLMIRRQTLKDCEPFWSPPTRRVAQAVALAFFTGLMAGLFCCFADGSFFLLSLLLVPAWMMLYGLGMYSAGFFMPRGIKVFGAGFVLAGFAVLGLVIRSNDVAANSRHCLVLAGWLMGVFFGGGHAAYGLYLHFTEKRGKVA